MIGRGRGNRKRSRGASRKPVGNRKFEIIWTSHQGATPRKKILILPQNFPADWNRISPYLDMVEECLLPCRNDGHEEKDVGELLPQDGVAATRTEER